MNAGLLDVLHDPGDEHLLAVGERIDVDLDRVGEEAVDQDRGVAEQAHRLADIADQALAVAHDLHGAPAEHIGRAHQHRIADALGDRHRLLDRTAGAVRRLAQAEALEQFLEAPAVLGEVDGVGRGADDRDARRLERARELERGLAAVLHHQPQQRAARGLDARDLDHVLGGQGLEIEAIGGVVVGRHRLRVAVDHDRLDPGLAQRIGGVNAAVVELDPLADAVRPAAEDDHLAAVGRLRLAFRRAALPRRALVGRVHVRGAGVELGGAGVDSLVDRVHA